MPADVSAPLPQLDLPPNAILTVTVDDPAALITRLTIHGWQETAAVQAPPSPITGAYTQGEAV